jgi:hypothetical protein
VPHHCGYFIFHSARLEHVREDGNRTAGEVAADQDPEVTRDQPCRYSRKPLGIANGRERARHGMLVPGHKHRPTGEKPRELCSAPAGPGATRTSGGGDDGTRTHDPLLAKQVL